MLIALISVAALINFSHRKLSIIRFFSILKKQNRFSFDFGFQSSIGFRFDYYSIQIDFIRFFRNRIGALWTIVLKDWIKIGHLLGSPSKGLVSLDTVAMRSRAACKLAVAGSLTNGSKIQASTEEAGTVEDLLHPPVASNWDIKTASSCLALRMISSSCLACSVRESSRFFPNSCGSPVF